MSSIHDVSEQANIGTIKPPVFVIGELEGNHTDVPLIPVLHPTPNSLSARWVEKGAQVKVDLAQLLAIRPFAIPRDTRAVIPVSVQNVKGLGPCLILHFGQSTFEPIEAEAPEVQAAEDSQGAAASVAATTEVPPEQAS